MDMPEKGFALKHVFENVSRMEEDKHEYSKEETHFNVPWRMYISRENGHLAFFLNCSKSLESRKWLIEAEFDLKLISEKRKPHSLKHVHSFGNLNGNVEFHAWGWSNFIKWEEMEKDFLVEDNLVVEGHVKIKKMTGIYKENLRSFDVKMSEFSDAVLIVDGKKFYISKLFLAAQSTYFKSLFLGNFEEAKKNEASLNNIDVEDFQKFLEVLYGEQAIDENTVDGIVVLADMYDAQTVIRHCETFLIEKSKKTLKNKLDLSVRYNLENLKNKCLSDIKTIDDVQSVIPADINELDPFIARELLQKQTAAISAQRDPTAFGKYSFSTISWDDISTTCLIVLVFIILCITLLVCYNAPFTSSFQ